MNSIRFLVLPALATAFLSCAPKQDAYDTSNPYGTPDGGTRAGNAPYQPAAPANPTYDTPAAYEDSGAPVVDPTAVAPATPAQPGGAAAAHAQAATSHVVVKGDTLSGIASKYKVPMASIKQANNMTKDTVVLGKKMIIPAR